MRQRSIVLPGGDEHPAPIDRPALSGKSVRSGRSTLGRDAFEACKLRARKIEIRLAIQADLGCPVLRREIFYFRFPEQYAITPLVPPHMRGVTRRHER